MNRHIYIRADGNTQIGLGHLTRCLALSQMLQPVFAITFVCKEITKELALEIENLSMGILYINEENDFIDRLTRYDLVVLDHYDLDTNYQIAIKRRGAKLISIDDLHDKIFFSDLIINHAPGVLPKSYKAQYYTQFATGLEYVLLRPVFLKAVSKNVQSKMDSSIFICFGGSDSKNLTQVVVHLLKKDYRFKLINVVVGSAYAERETLEKSIENDKRFKLHFAIDASEMTTLIASSEIAIVPASGILQEVLALKTKAISGIYASNQKEIFNNYKKLNAFVSAENFSETDICNAIDEILQSNQLRTVEIDGKSGDRILKYFKQFLMEEDILIREVIDSDLDKTFEWASDPLIRQFFFNTAVIDFEEHKTWFLKRLNTESCSYYIGIIEDRPFGSIRFDISKNVAIVSYLIDPNYHGKGLGTLLLKKGLDLFVKQQKNKIKLIKAEVLSGNLASIKIFHKLGYLSQIDPTSEIYIFEKLIETQHV